MPEHAFVLCRGNTIELEDLPLDIRNPDCRPPQMDAKALAGPGRPRKRSKEQLVSWLEAMQWNKTDMAHSMGLSWTSIWKYMKEYGIPLNPPESREND